jgi:hypothetical protein
MVRKTKVMARGSQCGYHKGDGGMRQCRKRTRTFVLILAHTVPSYIGNHEVGSETIQTHWEARCVAHRDK